MIEVAVYVIVGIVVGHFVPEAYTWIKKQFDSAKAAVEKEIG